MEAFHPRAEVRQVDAAAVLGSARLTAAARWAEELAGLDRLVLLGMYIRPSRAPCGASERASRKARDTNV